MSKVLYRYEVRYSNYDDGGTDIRLIEFPVVRETDKTYFIQSYRWGSTHKQVRKNSFKPFAHSNKSDALDHFIRRTERRVSWYKFWINECEAAIEIAKETN